MQAMNQFIERLTQLTVELEKLGTEIETITQSYDGNAFEQQKHLVYHVLENYLLSVTHETASILRFSIEDLKMLTNFIDFRRTFQEVTEHDLEALIDEHTPNAAMKLDWNKKWANGNAKVGLQQRKNVQQAWLETFGNQTYQHIKTKFK